MSNFERQFFEYFQLLDRKQRLQPLVLGGITASGGGTGSPIGGFIGQLPQTEVTYDLSEDATLDTVPSGESLVDNLNHIRYRIGTLETLVGSGGGGGGNVSVYDDGTLQGAASELDFTTGIVATVAAGRATISSSIFDGTDKIVVINAYTPNTRYYEASNSGLQSAIDNITTDDVIFVPPGLFEISPYITTTKSFSIIGAGSMLTEIDISGGNTDQWLFKMDYTTYNSKTTIKGITFYFGSEYAYSGDTVGGFMFLRSSFGMSIEDVRIMGDMYSYDIDVNEDVLFYGLYFNGDSAIPRSGYEYNSRVRNVSVSFYAGGDDQYFNIIGAYIKNYDMENVEVVLDDLDWSRDVRGLVTYVYRNINPYVWINRSDSSYNGDMIGITNKITVDDNTTGYTANELKNPTVSLINSSYYNPGGSNRVIGIWTESAMGDDWGDNDPKIINPYVYCEVNGTDGRSTTLVTPFKLESPYRNYVITGALGRIKTNRSLTNPVATANIHWIYNETDSFSKDIDIYNSAFDHIDENDDPLTSAGSFSSVSTLRTHNTYTE